MHKHTQKENNMIGEALLLDTEQLAGRLSMTTAQISRLQRQGRIPCIRLGHRTHRFSLTDVMEALQRQTRKAVV